MMTCYSRQLVILVLLCCVSRLYANNGCYKSIISFGDSLADTGNLKELAKISKVKFPVFLPPYGESFLDQQTGRCSNGRLIIDFLAESLELPLVPPYVHDREIDNALAFGQGVNYAVAGATALNTSDLATRGILNLMTNASLEVQLEWFKRSLPSICGNTSDCKNFIGRSLILVGEIGGNDYNYPILEGKPVDELNSLVPLVIDRIISVVNELIEMGAQTLVVPGNFPVGCLSAYLTICGSEKEEYDPETGCLVRLNEFAEYHNELLQTRLNQIRELHPNVNVIYADYYNAAIKIYRSPDKFGTEVLMGSALVGAGGVRVVWDGVFGVGFRGGVWCDNMFAGRRVGQRGGLIFFYEIGEVVVGPFWAVGGGGYVSMWLESLEVEVATQFSTTLCAKRVSKRPETEERQ
ncbi:SGNH hydrolase-type esterase domain-containing protein [Tanacetum coccineum]